MPPYTDVYVLSQERTAEAAVRFLNEFVPRRSATTDRYEFPQYSERPAIVLPEAETAIQYCAAHSSEAYGLYFRNELDGPPDYAMLFFTPDGGMILGLSVEREQAQSFFERLKAHSRSDVGYTTVENPPAATASEFRGLALNS